MAWESQKNIEELHKSDLTDLPEDEASTEAPKKSPPEKENSELEELRLRYSELEDKYKRLWADQQNMINRLSREREEIHKFAAQNTIEAILPALDNFDFAKRSINQTTKIEEVLKSFEMLKSQLLMSLQSVGLQEIPISGTFDPEIHEAVSKIKDTEKPEGTIVEILKTGYKLNGRLIRPATVIVSSKDL
jgi:molecular chaperone GrpE